MLVKLLNRKKNNSAELLKVSNISEVPKVALCGLELGFVYTIQNFKAENFPLNCILFSQAGFNGSFFNDCFAERFDDAEEAPRFQHPLPDGELGSTAQHAPSNGVRANESDWTHRTGGLSPLRLAVAGRTQCDREGTFRQQHQWTALPGLATIAILFCLPEGRR